MTAPGQMKEQAQQIQTNEFHMRCSFPSQLRLFLFGAKQILNGKCPLICGFILWTPYEILAHVPLAHTISPSFSKFWGELGVGYNNGEQTRERLEVKESKF